jgi:hypothetical protein
MLASGTQDRGLNPAEAVGFSGKKKILSMPSFEVLRYVKEPYNDVGVALLG